MQDDTYTAGRRGVGATVLVEKIAGAAADQGAACRMSRMSRGASMGFAQHGRRADVVHGACGRSSDV